MSKEVERETYLSSDARAIVCRALSDILSCLENIRSAREEYNPHYINDLRQAIIDLGEMA